MDKHEIETSLADQIVGAHRICMECDGGIRSLVIKKMNAARQAGILLKMSKERMRPPEWAKWIQSNLQARDPQLTETSCLAYLKVAQRNPEPLTNVADWLPALREAMIASGQVAPPRGHGPQNLHEPNFGAYVAKQLNAFRAEYRREISARPVRGWSLHKAEAFVIQVEPIAKDLATIVAEAKERVNQCRSELASQPN